MLTKVLYEAGFIYMGLNMSIEKFISRMNKFSRYLLYFPEENPRHLDQTEIIEILDQVKSVDPICHEAMINNNIDIFKMSYEESVSYQLSKSSFSTSK
jgi:hypothetical protein